MLSGGGVLGFYHLGVVKTLLDEGLLPRVISGSSAGSLVAGTLGTHTDKELQHFYDPANVLFEAEREASAFSRMFFGANPQIDVSDLEKLVARMIPDMTFQEAYEKTGRQISISVAPAELHQRSRLLNAITSPNVYVRSAVMASCAVPGVFPPVMLMAKNQHGDAQPYLPTRKWVDGSIADDLPAKRLQRLYCYQSLYCEHGKSCCHSLPQERRGAQCPQRCAGHSGYWRRARGTQFLPGYGAESQRDLAAFQYADEQRSRPDGPGVQR